MSSATTPRRESDSIYAINMPSHTTANSSNATTDDYENENEDIPFFDGPPYQGPWESQRRAPTTLSSPSPSPSKIRKQPPWHSCRPRSRYPQSGSASTWWRLGRASRSPAFWVVVILLGAVGWMKRSGIYGYGGLGVGEIGVGAFAEVGMAFWGVGKEAEGRVKYVGRWTPVPNRMWYDGTFPGVYFDLNITNTSSLLLSLRNSAEVSTNTITPLPPSTHQLSHPHGPRLSLPSKDSLRDSAAPVDLLVRIDDEEYVLLPESESLVSVKMKDLEKDVWHYVRVIAPMAGPNVAEVVQLRGIWLDRGGIMDWMETGESRLISDGQESNGREPDVSNSSTDTDESDDRVDHEEEASEKPLQSSLGRLWTTSRDSETTTPSTKSTEEEEPQKRESKKLVEIVTDFPGLYSPDDANGTSDILAGVLGWEFLLGEMFGIDHSGIGLEGMCLVQDCVGGFGSPMGVGDVFCQSGPPGSYYADSVWTFQQSTPDAVILNLGASDARSFSTHNGIYNTSLDVFSSTFADTYLSLIRAIRTLAYPAVPSVSTIEDEIDEEKHPVQIFVMRPLRGEMEHATVEVVRRAREEGDGNVWWIDTSGWVKSPPGNGNKDEDTEDFFLLKGGYEDADVKPRPTSHRFDKSLVDADASDVDSASESSAESDFSAFSASKGTYRLTPRGNQKVAIFLHQHLCPYLATDTAKCGYLKKDSYDGKVFQPEMDGLERWIDKEKERTLKEVFWDEAGNE
ncbi:hypothetical protein K402DRAFT_461512 [Aulographum hederae CBS 113979]|uniref:SGNH hydrolase-type esterase domain-containing protein n=1 Tax=Aulographum hederae CBS 113979 TaxID=1176131 RepID=A0A6G1H7C6_9PEZI|nr:hypothetical protein K402DRAFT_461512 [Aulographum hederae CBS 113979]